MKKFSVLLFLVTSLAMSQDFKIDKVTVEQLQQKRHPSDTTAIAAVMHKVGQTTFNYTQDYGFSYRTEVSTRIKVYKKEGTSLGTISRTYFIGSPKEKLQFRDAATYNLEGGKIVKSKLRGEGEFEDKINKEWGIRKITLPDIREGSIIEYTYTIESPYLSTIDPWDFQMGIPVDYCQYTTMIPEYFDYRVTQRGYVFPEVKQTIQKRKMDYSYMDKDMPRTNSPGLATSERRTTEFNELVSTYTIQNVPAMRDEDYVNNINNYIAGIKHELQSTRYPNAPAKQYAVTWEDVVKSIYDNPNFGGELAKGNFFQSDLQAALAGASGHSEKAAAIFSFVKNRMNWNGDFGYLSDRGIKRAYDDKIGNVAEINLTLVSMLRSAGLQANPVLISTRSNGIPLTPSRTGFNYVVAAIEVQDGLILLDATSKYTMPNILPIEALNWTGLIVRENGSSASVDLMPKINSKDVVTIMADITPEGYVRGKLRDQYFDYNAMLYRTHYKALSKDAYIEKLEGRFAGLEIESLEVQDSDLSKPVVENIAFNHTDAVDVVGDKMFMSPLLFLTRTENPFKAEKREYPVDFSFPHQDKYTISLTIPAGYQVESIPQPQQISMERNLGSFSFNISSTGNKLQVLCTFDINHAIVAPEDYPMLQSFFKQVIEKQNEKIVLKKV